VSRDLCSSCFVLNPLIEFPLSHPLDKERREDGGRIFGNYIHESRSAIAQFSTGLKLVEASACSIFSKSAALCAIASQQVSPGIASKGVSTTVVDRKFRREQGVSTP